ncbi:hypothetical protein AAZX31_09G160700 [Glycine max]|nr:hypothetical protein GLYMA_09G177951v4 [Glycine max]KAH1043525.1 hypothetical protein GYH30_025390 [Glycine max]
MIHLPAGGDGMRPMKLILNCNVPLVLGTWLLLTSARGHGPQVNFCSFMGDATLKASTFSSGLVDKVVPPCSSPS